MHPPLSPCPGRLGDKPLAPLAPARRRRLSSSASMYRSSRNLEWVKSKFKSLRSNLHEASLALHAQAHQGQADPYVTLRLVPDNK